MKIYKKIIFFLLIITLPAALFSQTGVSLETEIQNAERLAGNPSVSAAERHGAFVRLARLRQLSGDIEGAARNWLEAAAAIPGQVDDDALLSCAYCLAAMGEWDRASAALEPLLAKSLRARVLYTGLNALSTGNNSALSVIASSEEYSRMKSEIYYLLWKASSGSEAEGWRARLLSEFPQSPEGMIASGASQSAVLRQSPFWLFIGGLDSLPLAAIETPQTVAQTGVKLQTGIYSQEPNAQSMAVRLRQAGFNPSIEKRGELWAVTVPAGSDTNRTIRELSAAGFESFPLR